MMLQSARCRSCTHHARSAVACSLVRNARCSCPGRKHIVAEIPGLGLMGAETFERKATQNRCTCLSTAAAYNDDLVDRLLQI